MTTTGPFSGSSRAAARGGETPRCEPRQVVPVISFSIAVVLALPERTIRGRLWDISRSGACLLLPAHPDLQAGQEGLMQLHHPYGGEAIQTDSRLVWVDEQVNVAYAGTRFLNTVTFEGTFLGMLVSRSNRQPSTPHPGAGPGSRPSL